MGDRRCWCGATDLTAFSPDYQICGACQTLVATATPDATVTRVDDDERDFYGRRYWFEYQQRELGTPDITIRARQDLPERCVHWLRAVLRYRLPPGRALDLGCAHGAFVMLLARAGYEAMGLELSPWVVDFARKTFGVPMLQGPIEAQSLAPRSLHVLTMMDVIEHLDDPVTTLEASVATLHEDGILIIQTPAVPPDLSFDAMVALNHPFLPLMRERGHLYLFNPKSLQCLLERAGLTNVSFEPAYFAAYDMFALASRRPLVVTEPDAIAHALGATADGRLVQALLDLDDNWQTLQSQYEDVERDRAARLAALHEHGARLVGAEGERNALLREMENLKDLGKRLMTAEMDRAARLAVIQDLGRRLAAAEADREARLTVIQDLGERLATAEGDRAARLTVIEEISERLAAAEADRAARLAVIQEQAERLATSEADRTARLAVIHEQAERLATSEADRAARLAVIHEQGTRLTALEQRVIELGRQISEVENDRADKVRAMNEQEDRLRALAADGERMHAELAVLRGRSVRANMRKAVRWLRARLGPVTPTAGGERDRPAAEAATARPTPSAPSSAIRASGAVQVYESLVDYVRSIDGFTQQRPDLAAVRAYNHAMVDVLDGTVPLSGLTLLDVGASPHGFSLERALDKDVAVYLGVGLGVFRPLQVRHDRALGRLVAGYGDTLPIESESVDVAMSLSTFEHFLDGAAVLREVHRVLRHGGRLFANFQPVWTSSAGHHLHERPDIAQLIPPWAHLLWTPATMRRALIGRWPADAPMSMDDAVRWIYESHEINRLDVVGLRGMFEAAPFTVEWMTPMREDDDGEKARLATYLSTVLPYSAEDLLTLGFSIMMRKT